MRPEIQEQLAARIESIYRETGYTTKSEFVNDAIRRRLETLERGFHPHSNDKTLPDFSSRAQPHSSGIQYGINPFTIDNDPVYIDTYSHQPSAEILLSDTRHPRQLTARLLRHLTPVIDEDGGVATLKYTKNRSDHSGYEKIEDAETTNDGESEETDDDASSDENRSTVADEEVNVVIIDTDEEYINLQKALDGWRTILGGNVAINPLAIAETPSNTLEASSGNLDPYTGKLKAVMNFFETYFYLRGDKLDGGRRGVLEKAVKKAYEDKNIMRDPDTHSRESPTIDDVMDVLQSMAITPGDFTYSDAIEEAKQVSHSAENLLVGMQPFTEGGDYENLTLEDELTFEGPFMYFDVVTRSDPQTTLTMQALITRVYEWARQTETKTLIVIDSLRHLLETEPGLEWLTTYIEQSSYCQTATHLVVEDTTAFLQTPGATEILDQTPITHIHPEAIDTTTDRIGVDPAELEFAFTNMPSESGTVIDTPATTVPITTALASHEQTIADFDRNADDLSVLRDIHYAIANAPTEQ